MKMCRCLLVFALTILVPLGSRLMPDVQAQASDQLHILYINSYQRGYAWSDDIEEGLQRRFSASDKKIHLSFEYLDSRHLSYADRKPHLAEALRIKHQNHQPDLLVISDNAALEFVSQYQDDLLHGQPVVFCGINNVQADDIASISRITGINEDVPLTQVVELALKVHPKTDTMVFITSTKETTFRRIYENIESIIVPAYTEQKVVVLKDVDQSNVQSELASLSENTLVFLAGQLTDQKAHRTLNPARTGKLVIDVSPFPTYTMWKFHLNLGVIGGYVLTGQSQGEAAAEMALRILSGTPVEDIPIMMKPPASMIFDWRVMQKFNIGLDDLPIGSEVLNLPSPSLWDSHRWEIILALTTVIVQTALILALVVNAREKRLINQSLESERALLCFRVKDRTRELELANQRLQELNIRDALTGIYNRGYFDSAIEAELNRVRRVSSSLALMMLDVDHFKQYNDTYGHTAGDECLKHIADALCSIVRRSGDIVARYGGEEFIVILPGTDAGAALKVGQNILECINQLAIPHSSSDSAPHITISIGLVSIAKSGKIPETSTELINHADQQLYTAKQGGRNRIEHTTLS